MGEGSDGFGFPAPSRIEGFLTGFEGVDQTLVKADIGHDFLPVFVAPREQKRAFLLPGNKNTRENSN